MKKIIDSNQLRSDRLRAYLAGSKENIAVLCDYVAMEAYKGSPVLGMFESMKILAQYPKQVVVLRPTSEISRLDGCSVEVNGASGFVDAESTKHFDVFIKCIEAAKGGSEHEANQIKEHGDKARVLLNNLARSCDNMEEMVNDAISVYSEELINAIISCNCAFIGVGKFKDSVFETTEKILGLAMGQVANRKCLTYTFVFRSVLCHHLLVMKWLKNGGAKGVSSKRHTNDFVDLFISTYATFFDGLMSEDANACELHDLTKKVLTEMFGVT